MSAPPIKGAEPKSCSRSSRPTAGSRWPWSALPVLVCCSGPPRPPPGPAGAPSRPAAPAWPWATARPGSCRSCPTWPSWTRPANCPREDRMYRDLFLFEGPPPPPPPAAAAPAPAAAAHPGAARGPRPWRQDRAQETATRPQDLRYLGYLGTASSGRLGAFMRGEEPVTIKQGDLVNPQWRLVKLTDSSAEFQNLKFADLRHKIDAVGRSGPAAARPGPVQRILKPTRGGHDAEPTTFPNRPDPDPGRVTLTLVMTLACGLHKATGGLRRGPLRRRPGRVPQGPAQGPGQPRRPRSATAHGAAWRRKQHLVKAKEAQKLGRDGRGDAGRWPRRWSWTPPTPWRWTGWPAWSEAAEQRRAQAEAEESIDAQRAKARGQDGPAHQPPLPGGHGPELHPQDQPQGDLPAAQQELRGEHRPALLRLSPGPAGLRGPARASPSSGCWTP